MMVNFQTIINRMVLEIDDRSIKCGKKEQVPSIRLTNYDINQLWIRIAIDWYRIYLPSTSTNKLSLHGNNNKLSLEDYNKL